MSDRILSEEFCDSVSAEEWDIFNELADQQGVGDDPLDFEPWLLFFHEGYKAGQSSKG